MAWGYMAFSTCAPTSMLTGLTGSPSGAGAPGPTVIPVLVVGLSEDCAVSRCADTWVGNAMVRGISGGERKRMSTVEMLMGHQRVQILDEISTGLVRPLWPRPLCLCALLP